MVNFLITFILHLIFNPLLGSTSPSSTRCSCVDPSSCNTQLYGRLAQDIALLGLHSPCPTHGEVLCCDRSGLENLYAGSRLAEEGGPRHPSSVTARRKERPSIVTARKTVKIVNIPGSFPTAIAEVIRDNTKPVIEDHTYSKQIVSPSPDPLASPKPPSSTRCTCVAPSSCSTQLYGRLAQDIALLGLHSPCPTHGEVLCCDRSGLEHLYESSQLDEKGGPSHPSSVPARRKDRPSSVKIKNKNINQETTIRISERENSVRKVVNGGSSADRSSEGLAPSEQEQTQYRCGCIPRGVCLAQFRRVSDTCGGQLDMCCVPASEDSHEIKQLTAAMDSQEEQSLSSFEDSHESEQLLAVADSIQLRHVDKMHSQNAEQDRYSLPCVAASKCQEVYGLSPLHIAQFGVMPVCAPPAVRCVKTEDKGNKPYDQGKTSQSSVQSKIFPQVKSVTPPVTENINQEAPQPSNSHHHPVITIVPCISPHLCPGTLYSTLSPQHRSQFGLLAQCTQGMVRCVYQLDMEMFMHDDNFNLPIFNVREFIGAMSESKSETGGTATGHDHVHTEPVPNKEKAFFPTKTRDQSPAEVSPSPNKQVQRLRTGVQRQSPTVVSPSPRKEVQRLITGVQRQSPTEVSPSPSKHVQRVRTVPRPPDQGKTFNQIRNIKERLNLPSRKFFFKKSRTSIISSKVKSTVKTAGADTVLEGRRMTLIHLLRSGSDTTNTIKETSTTHLPVFTHFPATRYPIESEHTSTSSSFKKAQQNNHGSPADLLNKFKTKKKAVKMNSTASSSQLFSTTITSSRPPQPLVIAGPAPVIHLPHHHLPDARQLSRVEIDMPHSQPAKVMLHMDKDFMEVRLEEGQLLPVLQALLNALGNTE